MKLTTKVLISATIVEEAPDTIEQIEEKNGFKLGGEDHQKYMKEAFEEILKDELGDRLKEVIISFRDVNVEETK